jgi:hypothetical protein
MVLLEPAFWLILLPTGITGIFLMHQAKKLATPKTRKAPVPVHTRR